MKHIFTYIDTVEVLLKHVPLSLDAPKDIAKAENILTKIEKYTHLLKGLVKTHKNEKYLKKLKNAHIKEVENWAEKVEGLFKKFEEYLNILETDCKVLRDVIKNHPEKWSSKVRDLSFGLIMIGLDDEEEDMKRFRKIAIFEIEELKSVIDIEKHIHLSNTNDLLNSIKDLQLAHNDVPRYLKTSEDKTRAIKIVEKTEETIRQLEKRIAAHETYLRSLKQSQLREMKEWKDNITDFYNRLTSLLKTLSHDVSILRHTIENEPEKWEEKVEGMTLAMISNHTSTGKAASDRFAIIKFIEGSNNVNVKKIIKYEDHIAELFE